MGKLLQLIAKLFGKNAISKTLGTRTNVIKLPGNEQKRLIKDELNIEAASDLAAQKVLKEAEDLIAEIPKMNDQEILTLTGNLQRLDNKINPPSAEVLDPTTKKPITGEGLEQLAARDGLPADVSPDSPIGRVMQGAQILRKEKDELDRMLKDPVKQLEQEMQNPYRAGGALDPKMGIVRTAARQVLQKLAREGKINIGDEREAKAIKEGSQGGVDPIEVFRKTFGQDALGDLANLGDELLEIDNRGGSFKDIKKILDDEGFFDLQQPKSPAKGMTDEELMKRIKSEDPEEFATGGRVGFDDGGILSLEEAKKLNPGMFVDTTTYNPIPENAPNMAADEIAKVIMGTGFLREEDDELGYPEGMEKPMSSREFIFKSYVVPKRKELMENFGLTMKEADDLIREGMAKYRTNKAIGGRVGFQKGTSKIFDQLEMDVPHPYGHRVNYQIGGPAYDATDPIYGSSAITVTPDTIMGPQGNQIQAQMGKPSMTSQFFSGLKPMDRSYATRAQDIARPYIDMATKAGYGNVSGQIQGIGSDVRHTVGASMGKDSVIDFISQFGVKPEGRFADFIGNAAIFGSTAAQELQDAYGSLKRGEGLAQPFEDVKANFAAMNLPYGSSEQEKLDYAIAQSPSKSMIDTVPSQLSSLPNSSPSTSNNLLSLFEKYKGIQTPVPADPESGFVGETALGNMEKDIKSFLGSNYGLKYGKDIPSDIDDIYSFIEAERRSFSPDLSQNYYGGNLYNYLQDFYTYKYGDPRIDNFGFSGREDVFKSYFNKPYKFGLASGGRVGYAYGSGLKLAQLLQKTGKSLKQAIKEAVDNINPTGDKKLDADMAVDDMLETYSIDRDAVDGYDILNAYDEAYKTIANPKTMSESIKEGVDDVMRDISPAGL